jgi:Lrp/AsnC family transcriptional regulator for asnA, asnC and gidA
MNKFEIDDLDKQILNMLINDAREPFTEIAKKLNVSGGTVHFRVKKLEDAGIINSSNINIDPTKLGYDIVAYLGIYMKNSHLDKDGIDRLKKVKEIVELQITTGKYTLLAKIICKDTKDLYTVLGEKIQSIEGVSRTETFICLEEIVSRPLEVI